MKLNSFLALALSVTAAAALLLHESAATSVITPQVLPCAATAALRASFAARPSSSFPSSCATGARCQLSLVSLAAGGAASSSSSSSAPLRNGINAVSVQGMEPGVWEASATCERGCAVAIASVGGGENGSTSSISSSSFTASLPFLIQQCNGTLSQSMAEMEARFVVREARNEAGEGKGKVSSSSAARVVRVAAATAALAASQLGLVALAVA